MTSTAESAVRRAIARLALTVTAIVCLAAIGAPVTAGSEGLQGKLCCDETCSREFREIVAYSTDSNNSASWC